MVSRFFLLSVFLLLVGTRAVAAESANISVREAHQRAQSGEIILVDIRTPREWRASGVPAGSKLITMNQSRADFVAALKKAGGGSLNKPVALICAVGGRSRHLQYLLNRAGIPNTINVLGGMFGTSKDIGWLRAGLPVRPWEGPKPQ